jgi:hypothetical protein
MRTKRTLQSRLRDERGISLIITSISLVALLGVSALVVDIGNAFQRGRTAQNVTDAAALAGGWDLPGDPAKATAAYYVADNLDDALPAASACPTDDAVTADTTCYQMGTKTVMITTPWNGSEWLLRVDVCDDVDTSFGKVIGFDAMTVCKYSIAEVEPTVVASPGGPTIQAFGQTDKKAFETTGNGTIWTNGDIFIASTAGEAFVANGSGGVTATANVWYDSTGGGCALPPHCGDPGFLDETSDPPAPEGNLPVGCNPQDPSAADYCGDTDFFLDVHRSHIIRSLDTTTLTDLAGCLTNGINADPQCDVLAADGTFTRAGDWPELNDATQFPVTHSVNNSIQTVGPARTGTADNPSCDNGDAIMNPGYYSTTAQYSIQGCVIMKPGIYLFAGGFDVEAVAYLRGNNVLLINGHDKTVSRFTKSTACLTGLTSGPYENFLYYQNPDNANTFDIESDSVLFLAGIIYIPTGEGRIQGASAGTSFGGDGASGCLGESTLLGGSLIARAVLVKSDGVLSINAFTGGEAAGGYGWVRLYE